MERVASAVRQGSASLAQALDGAGDGRRYGDSKKFGTYKDGTGSSSSSSSSSSSMEVEVEGKGKGEGEGSEKEVVNVRDKGELLEKEKEERKMEKLRVRSFFKAASNLVASTERRRRAVDALGWSLSVYLSITCVVLCCVIYVYIYDMYLISILLLLLQAGVWAQRFPLP